jgi:hypothetical protein
VDGGEVPSLFSDSCPLADDQCGSVHCCVAVFSFEDICYVAHNKASRVSEGNEWHLLYVPVART